MDAIDFSLIDWTKALVGLLAVFHWLFAPMALGLSVFIAIIETISVSIDNDKWRKISEFWKRIFTVNWVATLGTGLIVLFAIGNYWGNFSWLVADIMSVPLVLCAVFVFFLESVFVMVLMYGKNHTSKAFYLSNTYMMVLGVFVTLLCLTSVLSWMQNPVGIQFNPETSRFEMNDWSGVLFSDGSIYKFLHIISTSMLMAGVLVVGIGACFFRYGRYKEPARDSIKIGAFMGLMALMAVVATGFRSDSYVAETQPLKWEIINTSCDNDVTDTISYIDTWVEDDKDNALVSVYEKINRGREAQRVLSMLRNAEKGSLDYEIALRKFYDPWWIENHFSYFGYGYFYHADTSVMKDNIRMLIPNTPFIAHSYTFMKWSGVFFLIFMAVAICLSVTPRHEDKKWFSYLAIVALPVVYMSSMAGWVVSEATSQPWMVKDLMPMFAAVSQIPVGAVQVAYAVIGTFLFIVLCIEISIIRALVKKGFN